jgi:membrane-associated HD superfamily phosphohydrolase
MDLCSTVVALHGLFYDIHTGPRASGNLAGIYSIHQYRTFRPDQIRGGIGGLTPYIGVQLLRQTSSSSERAPTAMGALSGQLATALVSIALPVWELFKITTDIRLLELSNLTRPSYDACRLKLQAPINSPW